MVKIAALQSVKFARWPCFVHACQQTVQFSDNSPFINNQVLIVDRIQDTSPLFLRFLKELRKEFGTFLSANLYISPPGNQGLEAHYDLHDVIAIQLYGKKKWTIAASEQLPIRHPDKGLEQLLVTKGEQIEMKPGDLLYLPRGYAHKAIAQDEPSCHVAIGVYVMKYFHLLESLVEKAKEDVFYREALPHNKWMIKSSETKEKFRSQFENILKETDLDHITDTLLESFHSVYERNHEQVFTGYRQLLQLSPSTVLKKNTLINVTINEEKGKYITLTVKGNKIKFPYLLKESIEYMLKMDEFKIKEIKSSLTEKQIIALAKQLIQHKVIIIK